jgi:hypothetical protein
VDFWRGLDISVLPWVVLLLVLAWGIVGYVAS